MFYAIIISMFSINSIHDSMKILYKYCTIDKENKSEIKKTSAKNEVIEELIGTMIHFPSYVHELHLKASGNEAGVKHEALKELYEDFIDIADKFAEKCLAGKYTTDFKDKCPDFFSNDTINFLKRMKKFMDEKKEKIFNPKYDSDFLSVIDDAKDAIDSCLYKIRRLK